MPPGKGTEALTRRSACEARQASKTFFVREKRQIEATHPVISNDRAFTRIGLSVLDDGCRQLAYLATSTSTNSERHKRMSQVKLSIHACSMCTPTLMDLGTPGPHPTAAAVPAEAQDLSHCKRS